MSVTIYRNGFDKISHEYKMFPGGEPHVVLPKQIGTYDSYTLDARIRRFDDLGELLAVTDALRPRAADIKLFLPYFPGARQDRRFPDGAFTLKMYTDIINAQGYRKVKILDPHSLVTPALINNVEVVSVAHMAAEFVLRSPFTGIIVPDAGAHKRVEAVCDALVNEYRVTQKFEIIVAGKDRDEKTGRITKYDLDDIGSPGRYVVIDDICDGGATFTMLAEAFHRNTVNLGSWAGAIVKPTLDLWVTHGIFSNGLRPILAQYEAIGTTDSFFLPAEEEWLKHKDEITVKSLRYYL